MHGEGYLYYFIVGFIYWVYNLFVRKLHTKNEVGEGWMISLMWIFAWPLCFIILIIGTITDKYIHMKNKIKNKF